MTTRDYRMTTYLTLLIDDLWLPIWLHHIFYGLRMLLFAWFAFCTTRPETWHDSHIMIEAIILKQWWTKYYELTTIAISSNHYSRYYKCLWIFISSRGVNRLVCRACSHHRRLNHFANAYSGKHNADIEKFCITNYLSCICRRHVADISQRHDILRHFSATCLMSNVPRRRTWYPACAPQKSCRPGHATRTTLTLTPHTQNTIPTNHLPPRPWPTASKQQPQTPQT